MNTLRLRLLNWMSWILLLGISCLSLPVWSESKPLPYPTFQTTNGVSRFFQAVTGFTPVSGWLANRILRQELQRQISGKLQSRLSLYSGADLLGGKARGISLSGQQVVFNGFIPVSHFQMESVDGTPLFVSRDKRPILLNPLTLRVTARLSEADINAMLNSPQGQAILTHLVVVIPPFGKQALDVLNPQVSLEGDRLTLVSLVNKHDQPPEKGLPIQLSGRLSAEQSRLSLQDLDLQVSGFEPDALQEVTQFIEAYFSEIVNLNHIKVERHTLKVLVEQTEIIDRALALTLKVKVEPQRKYLEKYLAQRGKKANSAKN